MTNNDEIHYKHWTCDTPKAAVILIHGLGEHCGRYEALGDFLTSNNIALSAIDLPGHGQSSGDAGHIDDFSDYQQAVLDLHQTAALQYPDLPIFLLGHSMGGLIATDLLLDFQYLFRGALLSGAAIQSPQQPPNWQMNVIRFIAKIFPKLKLIKLEASKISRDPDVVKNYNDDPLVSKEKLSASFLSSMFTTMTACKNRAFEISLPINIMHGGGDVITSPAGSQYLHDNISSSDKTLTIYEGLYHEIFNEPEAMAIYQTMLAWVKARL